MHIQFKGTNYDLAPDVTDLATKKLQALRKFLGKYERPALAYVDLGKSTEAHQSGAIWYAEINLDVGGKRYNARAEDETLLNAFDKTIAELMRELRAAKQKKESVLKRSGAKLKEMFRFGT